MQNKAALVQKMLVQVALTEQEKERLRHQVEAEIIDDTPHHSFEQVLATAHGEDPQRWADLASISSIVRFLSMESAEAPDFFLKEIIEEPEIIGESISVLIGVMELWRKTFSVTPYSKERVLHPHPDIRQIFLSSWLTTRRPEDHSDHFFEIALAIHRGMESASDKVAKLGPSFLPYFSHLKDKDKHEIEDECEEIRQDLYDKLRPTLSTFSI